MGLALFDGRDAERGMAVLSWNFFMVGFAWKAKGEGRGLRGVFALPHLDVD